MKDTFAIIEKSSTSINDPCVAFGNHIAHELRKYDPYTRSCVKNAINTIHEARDLRFPAGLDAAKESRKDCHMIEKKYQENDLANHPQDIYNMDETGIQVNNKLGKVIATNRCLYTY